MSRHDDEVRLRHMLDHALEAIELCKGHARSDLDSNRLLNLGLVRLIEVVGEAANRVSIEFQGAHVRIPWRHIVGMRNRVIHGYDRVDFDLLWDTIQNDLPGLVEELRSVLGHGRPRV